MCLDALAHASEREMVFSTMIQAGRVGIMTNTTLLMEDIRLLSPTLLSTTPRYGGTFASMLTQCSYCVRIFTCVQVLMSYSPW